MSFNSLSEIFEAFNNLKVLVIGDVMVDSYIWGKVDRISPEAPVPIINVQKREQRLGGAANVALNVLAMGATPILCSMVGDDADAAKLLMLMNDKSLPTEGIVRNPNRITTIKHRVISGSHHMLRIDAEDDSEIKAPEQETLLQHIEKLLPECDVVIFEDYDKGVLTKNVIEKTIAMARKQGIPTVVDPKKRNFLSYREADLFKPNLKELKEGLKIDFNVNDPQELQGAVQQLKERLALRGALVTLSEKGMILDIDDVKHHAAAHIRSIADVSGAGDTVVSIAAICLALKLPPQVIVELANLGGGLVCEHVGVVPIDKEQLYKEALENKIF